MAACVCVLGWFFHGVRIEAHQFIVCVIKLTVVTCPPVYVGGIEIVQHLLLLIIIICPGTLIHISS